MTTSQIYRTIRKLKNGYNPRVTDEEIEATIEAIKEMKSAYIEELKAAQERVAEYRLLLRRIGENMMQQPVTSYGSTSSRYSSCRDQLSFGLTFNSAKKTALFVSLTSRESTAKPAK